ncbi:Lpg1974 family pore-forming outer membrane protein [Legionella waltersii]|uniref:Lpg1974 family pore-forming outer membrane protein n=1 Tax=Legionella waltersii TaxID=66969 RepID=UPI000730D5B8|nr:Lpg1974 family pore-forming outer membrane protein [Legionella waltersii]
MKKGLYISLFLLCNHLNAFQYTPNSFSFFSELLYWQVREQGGENWGQVLGPTGPQQTVQFLNAPFKWSPGFRLGIGYGGEGQLWDLSLNYTWYKTQATQAASTDTGEIHSSFLGNFFADNLLGAGLSGPYYHSASLRWNIQHQSLDIELGALIKANEAVHLRPFIGLKTAEMDQSIISIWNTPFNNQTKLPIQTFSSATENIKNDFRGIGPAAGIDSKWPLLIKAHQELALIGRFSGAFLWGDFTMNDLYQNNTPVSITIVNERLTTAATMVKGYIGIEWSKAFQVPLLTIQLGYEGQAWFNQLRYYNFDMGRMNNSLFIQGAVLNASIHC